MNSNEIINISICYDDLKAFMNANQSKFPQAKNGKVYVNLTAKARREPDKQGNDISVSFAQSKEERLAKADIVYVGSGKTFTFENQNASQNTNAPQANPMPQSENLPF